MRRRGPIAAERADVGEGGPKGVASRREENAPVRVVALARDEPPADAIGGYPRCGAVAAEGVNFRTRRHAPRRTEMCRRRVVRRREVADRVNIALREKRRIVFAESGRVAVADREVRCRAIARDPSVVLALVSHRVAPPETVAVVLWLGGAHVALRPAGSVRPQLYAAKPLRNRHHERGVGEDERTAERRGEVDHVRIRARDDVALDEGRAHVVRGDRELRDGVRGERPADRVRHRRLARKWERLVKLRHLHGVGSISHRAHRHRGESTYHHYQLFHLLSASIPAPVCSHVDTLGAERKSGMP